jgi:hypothetical protein
MAGISKTIKTHVETTQASVYRVSSIVHSTNMATTEPQLTAGSTTNVTGSSIPIGASSTGRVSGKPWKYQKTAAV